MPANGASPNDVTNTLNAARPLPVLMMVFSPTQGPLALAARSTVGGTDTTGGAAVAWGSPTLLLGTAPNYQTSSATAFWNAAVLGANAFSPGVNIGVAAPGTYGKMGIFATASVADTITAQYSLDNVNWFDVTQDNAGTIWTLALVAGHLSAYRDLPSQPGAWVRLVNVTAATVTAGYQVMGI